MVVVIGVLSAVKKSANKNETSGSDEVACIAEHEGFDTAYLNVCYKPVCSVTVWEGNRANNLCVARE